MTVATTLKRHFLDEQQQDVTVGVLQECLVDLLDAQLQCKQAHWNLVGKRFYSQHLQLDEIAKSAREAVDKVAERITALDASADGRAATIVADSNLEAFPDGRPHVDQVVTLIADRLAVVVETLRKGIASLQDVDAVSQNMLQDISQAIEQHLWMVQAQEEE